MVLERLTDDNDDYARIRGVMTFEAYLAARCDPDAVKEILASPALIAWLHGGYADYINRTSNHHERVQMFMERAGQPVPLLPCVPPAEDRIRVANLILEEFMEFLEASGLELMDADSGRCLDMTGVTITAEDVEQVQCGEPDLVKMVDALADLSVVVTGGFVACGVADEAVLQEVDANNLAKFGPGGYRNEYGKWVKPAGHTPPDLEMILRTQGWRPEGGSSDDSPAIPLPDPGEDGPG